MTLTDQGEWARFGTARSRTTRHPFPAPGTHMHTGCKRSNDSPSRSRCQSRSARSKRRSSMLAPGSRTHSSSCNSLASPHPVRRSPTCTRRPPLCTVHWRIRRRPELLRSMTAHTESGEPTQESPARPRGPPMRNRLQHRATELNHHHRASHIRNIARPNLCSIQKVDRRHIFCLDFRRGSRQIHTRT